MARDLNAEAARAFQGYLREDIDDCRRIVAVAGARGLSLSPLEASVIWRWFSEDRYAAGWISMNGLSDDQVWAGVDAFLRAYGGEE